MSHSAPAAPGRRATQRGSRLNLTTLLAVVLPILCALALVLVRPPGASDVAAPPTLTALTRASVVCASPMEGAPGVAMTSAADGVRGPVRVGLGEDATEAQIASGEVTTVDGGAGPVEVSGEDEAAPGLVAARFGADAPAVASCLAPAPHAWFTGVGAGAGHTSVLELTNPDSGTAVADVTVYGRRGVVDAPRLRGISVTGGSSVELDLASIVPRRDELALEVVAARGRLGATMLDRYDPVGSGEATQDWLPAQSDPAISNLLMGLTSGAGARQTLVVANGGPDEVRASVKVVTEQSVFTPKSIPDLRIPPQSTGKLKLTGALATLVENGATGLLVTANEPVTASLRSFADGDLSRVVPDPTVDGPSTVLLPPGGASTTTRTLLLAGATGAGVVDVVSRTASGRELDSQKVEVTADRGITVKLPAGAELVTVTPSRTTINGAVLVSGKGAAVVPLTMPAMNGLVPAVRPGLP